MPTITDIVNFLNAAEVLRELVAGVGCVAIARPASIINAQPGEVTFCGITVKNPQELLSGTRASLLILDRRILFDDKAIAQASVQAIILSDNARLDFIRVVEHFFAPPRPRGIHPTAVIAPSAVIATDVFIGPLCTIGARVEVGADTVIHAGVHIYDGVQIGCRVIVHSGTVIGADGFGYERNEVGDLEKFPHVGGVVIEDDVEIGANVCVDRGTLGDTRICQGVCIDNLVHVAHNVYVGRHAAVIADAMIGGGTRVGDYAWIAPAACLRDGITIGNKAVVGLAALVTKDVPEGTTVLGAPARELGDQKHLLAHWKTIISRANEGKV